MDELPLSAGIYRELDVELSPLHVFQPQETPMLDMDMEPTDADLGTLLAFGDLGPLSVDDISIEALPLDTDMESCCNDTYPASQPALMRDAKQQANSSDPLAQLLIRATFSDSTNKKIQDVDEKRDGNIVCPKLNGSACGQSLASVRSNSGHSFVQSDHFKHSFVNQTGQKPFLCDMCPKQFSTSSNYQRHRRIHTGEKPFQCDMCPKQFRISGNCKIHRRIHTGEKPFLCDICGKQFRTSSVCKTHRRTHTGEKSFQCDICAKRFRTTDEYKTHRRTHTGEKPFHCYVCGKRFCASGNYQTHRRIHTEEKPFQCELCPKRFRTSFNFQTHRRIHTGEKPFQCDICSKEFSTSSNCRQHQRTHGGEKSNICHLCTQNHCSKSELTAHVRKVHRETLPMQRMRCPSTNQSRQDPL